ncbi:hypothetical protein Tco_0020824 [Tanacetum coccineum]
MLVSLFPTAIHRRVLIMREREKCLFPSLLLQSQLAEVAQSNHQWPSFHHGRQISRSHPIRTESLETVSQAILDAVTTHQETVSHHFKMVSPRTDSNADLEDSSHGITTKT